MKIAVVGSRGIKELDLGKYLPDCVTEIVSGGARGVDTIAREYAKQHNIPLKEFLPRYDLYKGSVAPLKRNLEIIEYADVVFAFWDGKSTGTMHVINNCKKMNKPFRLLSNQ